MIGHLRTRGISLLRRAEDERGIALVTAIIVMATLLSVTATVIYFSTETFHTSLRADADQQAYSLAEAGINTAIAKIYGATDPRVTTVLHAGTAGDPATVIPKCSTGTNTSETPTCYSSGSVTYSGTLDKSGGNTWYWNITSTGSVPVSNVTTASRTLTRSVGVTGNNGTDGNSWTRFYQDSTSTCLTLDGVTVPTNFASKGDICLVNGAKVTGSTTNIQAGGKIYIDPPTTDAIAGSAVNTGSTNTWTNPTRAETVNASYATASLANAATSASLDITNFSLGIPSTATINGFSVSITRHASSSTSTNHVADATIQLLQGGTAVGTNKAATTTNWPTSDGVATYGTGTTDLWGATGWTYTNVNASNFGVRIAAKATASSGSLTPSVDGVSITVYYTTGAGIGASGASIAETDTGSGCQLSGNATHSPCGTSDKVYATTNNTVSAANNPNLAMPTIDWNYWWANAMPGPKHFCTNSNPGVSSTYFDNNASTTTAPDASLTVNGEVAPPGSAYDCEVWQNGVLQGELKWDGSHVLTIYGTIFFDGNFRFDDDGEIIHYFGRATLMSSHDDEIDALVCAGGTGTTYATSCLSNMSSWNPSQNMMVLMSDCMKGASGCNEYDQGGTTCTGAKPNCWDGYKPGGFQGILYSKGECLIHQEFQDSGPVICDTINMPLETYNPTYFTFPSIGNLTDGMSFSSTASATDFTLNVSAQNGG